MEYHLAHRMQVVNASEIREILKVTERPEILSFAGGLPAPELFPHKELAEHSTALLREEGTKALQYSTTEGYNPLREWIIARLAERWNIKGLTLENIMITSGSQSGLDLVSKVFLDEGDCVWTEEPTYLAALTSFRSMGAVFASMPCDDDGVIIEGLEERLKAGKPKFVYVIPTFQNPSGRTWTMERRRAFVELMTRYEVPIIEDNAYFEVCYDDVEYCSLCSFDTKGLVLSLGSFSKVLCPGLRVAWITGSKELIRRLVIIKQSTDLQTPTFSQMLVYRYLKAVDFNARVKMLCDVYRERRDAMIGEFEKQAPEGVRFTRPQGGMFVWVEMPEYIDSHVLLERCLKNFVAMVPGTSFYPLEPKNNMARFNFSNLPPASIRHGVCVICKCMKEEIEAHSRS